MDHTILFSLINHFVILIFYNADYNKILLVTFSLYLLYTILFYKQKAVLKYSLLVKIKLWTKTKKLIKNLTSNKVIVAARKIKCATKCTNQAILALKWQVQIVAAHVSDLYIQYFQFKLRLKTMIITNKKLILWITINWADL